MCLRAFLVSNLTLSYAWNVFFVSIVQNFKTFSNFSLNWHFLMNIEHFSVQLKLAHLKQGIASRDLCEGFFMQIRKHHQK